MGNCMFQCPDCHRPDMQIWNNEIKSTADARLDIRDGQPAIKRKTPFSSIIAHAYDAVEKGANGIIIMGGTTGSIPYFDMVRLINHLGLIAPVCLYSGLPDEEEIHSELVKDSLLSALKTGSYKKELGGLTSPTTNQRFYLIEKGGTDSSKVMVDITHKFYDENTNDQPKKR